MTPQERKEWLMYLADLKEGSNGLGRMMTWAEDARKIWGDDEESDDEK